MMKKEKFLLVGSGGRESAFAKNLAKDTQLYAVIGHKNPTIMANVMESGGDYLVDNQDNPQVVARFAQTHNIDYAFVSADGPLAAGVVDALLACDIKAVGGTKQATKIEWDKIYSIGVVHKVCPEFTPLYKVLYSIKDIPLAIEFFKQKGLQVVVKPQGLTGGKGVKVMPEHLPTYASAADYAQGLLHNKNGEGVLLVEKLSGIEFTIMGLTDGEKLVLAPASYDYPFRFENDTGAGTGGMGCFTDKEQKLPFMTKKDLADCQHIMQSVINDMRCSGNMFQGVLNGGFFKTSQGIRFMECNARFGDPEGLNILSLLQTPLSQLIRDIWHKKLTDASVHFAQKASVITYLVAKEYPQASREVIDFFVDVAKIERSGVDVFFASAIEKGKNQYQTLQTSRVMAIGAICDTIEEGSAKVNTAIAEYITGDLDYRKDIGSAQSLQKLASKVKNI